MRAALHRAAKSGNLDRARDLAAGSRRAHRAPPRSGAHASRWCVDELPEQAPRPPRLRADRRVRRNSFSSRTRVGPSELYGYDAHGNIRFLTDASGAETDTYEYDAWGNLVASTGSTVNTRLFAGEEFDPDLGLINLRARQYLPETGRFLTTDPEDNSCESVAADDAERTAVESNAATEQTMETALLEFFAPKVSPTRLLSPIGLNRYGFADLDPIGRVDPSGRDGVEYALLAKAGQALVAATIVYVGTQLLAARLSDPNRTYISVPSSPPPPPPKPPGFGCKAAFEFCVAAAKARWAAPASTVFITLVCVPTYIACMFKGK